MADRKSLEERRAALEGRRATMRAVAQPTAVHVQTVDVLTHLLEMGKSFQSDDLPPALRVMMRTVEHMKPTLTAELANVPPNQIVEFMRMIEGEIHKITSASPAPVEEDRTA